MSFFEPQTEPPPMYRSGRLQEEQRLVTKSCPFFWRTIFAKCPNFGGLESSRKSKCPPRKFLRSNNWDLNTWGWSCRKWRQREPYTVCRSGRSGSGGGCAGKKEPRRGKPGDSCRVCGWILFVVGVIKIFERRVQRFLTKDGTHVAVHLVAHFTAGGIVRFHEVVVHPD